MRQLTPCTACGRHHRADEAACPHCGVKAVPTQGSALVRNLKMGALMAFTAATATACYGGPPIQPINRPTAAPSSQAKVPTQPGTASYAITPTGAPGAGTDVLKMEKAQLVGTKLTITSKASDVPDTPDFKATFELPSLDKLVAGTAIELKDLKSFTADAVYLKADESPRVPHHLLVTMPGNDAVTGILILSEVTSTTLGGTLTFQTSEGKVALYFFCER